ncbi:MAG: Nif3-like dinuclear metal center hexameric protein [Gammaproteobacteria bacterium]|nr:Nif3-like dinuclear metal center hexameric protein [Gammaproteobacteria bacterium]
MTLHEMLHHLDDLLAVGQFNDYCPNGLQIEGRSEIKTLVTGVTASQALIDEAVAMGADALLVHHGYFWKGEDARITGIKRRRIASLLAADVSLLAYHLPLDAHPRLGNNVQLAERLGFIRQATAADGLLMSGCLEHKMSIEQLADHIGQSLERDVLCVGDGPAQIESLAWCSGAAQSYIDQAADLGVDAFISGEISEPTVHIARERGIHYLSCGHHATERYGVQALGEYLAQHFSLTHYFIDIDNPV